MKQIISNGISEILFLAERKKSCSSLSKNTYENEMSIYFTLLFYYFAGLDFFPHLSKLWPILSPPKKHDFEFPWSLISST